MRARISRSLCFVPRESPRTWWSRSRSNGRAGRRNWWEPSPWRSAAANRSVARSVGVFYRRSSSGRSSPPGAEPRAVRPAIPAGGSRRSHTPDLRAGTSLGGGTRRRTRTACSARSRRPSARDSICVTRRSRKPSSPRPPLSVPRRLESPTNPAAARFGGIDRSQLNGFGVLGSTHPGSHFAARCSSVPLSLSTRERLPQHPGHDH